jgi:hypothetical protein
MALAENIKHLDMPGTELKTRFLDPVQRLDPRERIFAQNIANGVPTSQAGRLAGYKNPNKLSYRVLKRVHVAQAIDHLAKQNRAASNMDREKVMKGFAEAIDMAKLQGDASTMVAGWREIGRMCGLYEPDKKTVDVNLTGKRLIGKLETLTTAELFELVEKDVTPLHENPALEHQS